MKWKILYFKSFFSIVITALFLGVASLLSLNASAQSSNTLTQHKPHPINSIIFYYGNNPPLEEMHAFDVAVVNDDAEMEPKKYDDANSQLFAYVTVGEALPSQIGPKKIQTTWLMGKNTIWKSAVIDLANPQWQQYFLEKIINPLWKKGYRGFFFDTLDSYKLVVSDPAKQAAQQQGLINVISAVKQQHPDAQIILNRGFEVISRVNHNVVAVAAESLFEQWDQGKKSYSSVSKSDRDYLLSEFDKVKALGLTTIAIDYVPEDKPLLAKETAKKINALGIVPYVGNNKLNNIGVSNVIVIPRKVFVLYRPTKPSIKLPVFNPPALAQGSFPLEYLGYIPELHSSKDPLPTYSLKDRYAGILVWAATTDPTLVKSLALWLEQQRKQGIPILFLPSLDIIITANNNSNLQLSDWGVETDNQVDTKNYSLKIRKQDKQIGYETKPYPQFFSFFPLKSSNADILLQIESSTGQTQDAIALTQWGGYALDPFTYIQLPDGALRWVINPLTFFPAALKLRALPAPDTTTENGRRLMMGHIDGDGFPSEVEGRKNHFAGRDMYDRILKRYKVPTDVSIIEGEIGPKGLFPTQSSILMQTAREIFALPWVEIATHTYSHPFNWQVMYHYPKNGVYNLPVTDYQYSIAREITGSADFINKYLAPKGKHCKMIFWSGQTNLDPNILKLAYDDHLNNINGGPNKIVDGFFSLASVDPLGVYFGKYFQVFATAVNEDSLTNLWNGPYYGFSSVIDIFEKTENPLRLKPIDIYYHFYSASKYASLKALETVYDWALKQPTHPIFEYDYANKVLDFNRTTFSDTLDGGIEIHTHSDLRELRLPKSMGYPDLIRSHNVIGFAPKGEDNYIHLGAASASILYLTNKKPAEPYLVEANARVIQFKRNKKELKLHLKGYVPILFTLANLDHCQVYQGKHQLKGDVNKKYGGLTYQLAGNDSHELDIRCE